jgi:predicted helicase
MTYCRIKSPFSSSDAYLPSLADLCVKRQIARAWLASIEKEYTRNRKFIAAFDTFAELCRTSLDLKLGTDVIKEMLIQHLLTERLFSTVFDNPDFIRRNAIAAEIEKVIDALTSHSFNRHEFLKSRNIFGKKVIIQSARVISLVRFSSSIRMHCLYLMRWAAITSLNAVDFS